MYTNKVRIKEIDDFLENLIAKKNISQSTIIAYEKDLNDFFDFMNAQNINILSLTEADFKNYFDNLKNKVKLASFKRKYSSIRNFYKYLWKNKLTDKIYEYSLEVEKTQNDKQEDRNRTSNFGKKEYFDFIESLGNDISHSRLKVISVLITELNISLVNIFEIQIRDLIKYDFKKIIINRNGKIYSYDLNERLENILKTYYEEYAIEKRFLFSQYNIGAYRKDLKTFSISVNDLKNALVEDEDTIHEKIRKIYFEIGIGDN